MSNSRNSDSGCLSAILRHLLCRNGIPTHPSAELDHLPCIQKVEIDHKPEPARGDEVVTSSSSSLLDRPGIVARLMGLETLPGDPKKCRKSPESFPRSRSVNFTDCLLDAHEVGVPGGTRHHRRVRTSVSFREEEVVRGLPRQQSHEKEQDRGQLLVLFLDELENSKPKKKKEARAESGRKEPGLRDPTKKDKETGRVWKERKVAKSRSEPSPRKEEEAAARQQGRKNSGRRMMRGKVMQEKEIMAESKFTKKRKDGKGITKRVAVVPVESDGSGASSPMSVLDVDECGHGISILQEFVQEYVNLSPKRDSSSSPPSKFLPPARVLDSFERRGNSTKEVTSDNNSVTFTNCAYGDVDYCLSVAMEVYRVTQEDIVKNSSDWVSLNGKAEDDFGNLCEEISALIELQVLDQMVHDLCATM